MAHENEIPASVLNVFKNSDKYNVLNDQNPIGCGAYGLVFLVVDKMTNKEVAAKVVAKATTNELKIWPTLNHPNILTLIRTDEIIDDAVAFITPDEGRDLFYMLYEMEPNFHDDKLCFRHKRAYMLHVLRGLEYLHGRNLCHLDLREENILIRKSNVAVIGDFSTLVYSEQAKDQQFGLHMKALPPEIVSSQQSSCNFDGTAAEMWTYGILVLQVFTKQYITRHTASDNSYEEYLPKVLNATKTPSVLAAFDEQHRKICVEETEKNLLFEFIENLLVKEPKDRKPAKDALTHEFMQGAETKSEKPRGEDLDFLIKQELESDTKNKKSLFSHISKPFSKMSLARSQVDLKNEEGLRNTKSLESISQRKELDNQPNSPERTTTLPKNFPVQSDSNFFQENRSLEQIEADLEEMSITANPLKNRPKEKCKLTTVSFYTPTGEVSQAVFQSQIIGDCIPQIPSAKWTDPFVKFFTKPKSIGKSKREGEYGIENPFYNDTLIVENDEGYIKFTAKGQVCEKPKRQWYWRLRAFGRMFSKGKLFKKRQKKDVVLDDKLNLM